MTLGPQSEGASIVAWAEFICLPKQISAIRQRWQRDFSRSTRAAAEKEEKESIWPGLRRCYMERGGARTLYASASRVSSTAPSAPE